jgi:ribosomal protein S12 methylthiotransferase
LTRILQAIDIINLGCSKNLVDAEVLQTQLRSNGVQVRINPDPVTAPIVIINTCGFIGDAKEESIDTILNTIQHKGGDEGLEKVYVMGCLSQRYKIDLQKEIPEVDGYYGVDQVSELVRDLGLSYYQDQLEKRQHSTAGHFAYLKIAEGCNRNCAFCSIPIIRGRQVSRPLESLLEEATYLAKNGTKELILIAQDLSSYGIDLYKKTALVQLVKDLEKINGIEWIRLHYTYPNHFPDELSEIMSGSKKICHYLDIPFQHISDNMLKIMRRGHTRADSLNLIRKLRKSIPDLAIRTTILVGHPGETDEDFTELVEFIRETRFDRLGVFTYSHEEGTHAFDNYADDVPQKVKTERASIIMDIQQKIAGEINADRVGTKMRVLIDRLENDHYVGRSQYDSPEVDNEILIAAGKKPLIIGSFYQVKIISSEEFDLYGEI